MIHDQHLVDELNRYINMTLLKEMKRERLKAAA
jgi:hypothetical protein